MFLISNPFCSYCKDAHLILEELLDKHQEHIFVQIRFNFVTDDAQGNDSEVKLITILNNIYDSKGHQDFLKALNFWYEKRDINAFSKNYPLTNYCNLDNFSDIGKENYANMLNFTPLFIFNGYKFPDKYNRDDIYYFIDDLIEDNDFLDEK